ncbi:MAG: hypothetical protein PVH21_18810 [Myxococcales bacterium]
MEPNEAGGAGHEHRGVGIVFMHGPSIPHVDPASWRPRRKGLDCRTPTQSVVRWILECRRSFLKKDRETVITPPGSLALRLDVSYDRA